MLRQRDPAAIDNGFSPRYHFIMEARNELTGELAIDLANTLRFARDGGAVDLLADEDGRARWLRGAGGPDAVGPSQLATLRGHVRALLAAAVARRVLPPAAVTAVNRASAAAPQFVQLEAGELVVRYHASPADAFLADIATSAVGLVGGPDRDRLRRCEAPGCGRWFLASRPRQTWCSPACGNRARLARFHERRRVA
jgi:predicted RNA-binding Zn ribbon-like protein